MHIGLLQRRAAPLAPRLRQSDRVRIEGTRRRDCGIVRPSTKPGKIKGPMLHVRRPAMRLRRSQLGLLLIAEQCASAVDARERGRSRSHERVACAVRGLFGADAVARRASMGKYYLRPSGASQRNARFGEPSEGRRDRQAPSRAARARRPRKILRPTGRSLARDQVGSPDQCTPHGSEGGLESPGPCFQSTALPVSWPTLGEM